MTWVSIDVAACDDENGFDDAPDENEMCVRVIKSKPVNLQLLGHCCVES